MPSETKKMSRPALLILAGFLLLTYIPFTLAAEAKREKSETDPLILKKLEWFQDLKFGLFIHWGIYSQWGCIESWPLVEKMKKMRPDNLKAWVERDKDMERFSRDYRALNKTFNPKQFDPQKWAVAANNAGMKYVVFTAKHHDGFCMYDTKQTDYRTTHPSCPFHSNPKADVTKAIVDTFRKDGFGIGIYFSKADWHHADYWDPSRLHKTRRANYDAEKEPEKWKRFLDFTHAQIEELTTGYGDIDILWLDGSWVNPSNKETLKTWEMMDKARKHQPDLIYVDRYAFGRYENYRTPEQKVPDEALPYVWETCMTMGQQWSYKPDDDYKSTRKLIHLLVDIVAKGGNFLLNIGPNADGELPEPALQRLKGIGDWMKVNGEAIYSTRPIAPYKQGQTCLTQKGSNVYLIYLAEKNETAPPDKIAVPAIRHGTSVRMLGSREPIQSTIGEDGLLIRIPEAIRESPPCQHAWVFEVAGATQ